jgi:hypothetical protein
VVAVAAGGWVEVRWVGVVLEMAGTMILRIWRMLQRLR